MKEGDFIKIEYIGRTAATREIFDLTQEDVAQKEGIYNPKQKYGPVFTIIGAHMVIPGMEKELLTLSVGQEKEFSVQPQEAFGSRIPQLVNVFSLTQFIRQKVDPHPGAFVEIDGMQGRVQSISGGRVRVDFNHPLAGKEVHYWVKIVSAIEKTDEKIKELIASFGFPFTPKIENSTLTIESEKALPSEVKKFIEEPIKKWMPEITEIVFSEKNVTEKKTENLPQNR